MAPEACRMAVRQAWRRTGRPRRLARGCRVRARRRSPRRPATAAGVGGERQQVDQVVAAGQHVRVQHEVLGQRLQHDLVEVRGGEEGDAA